MTDLAGFLLERIAEDERAVRENDMSEAAHTAGCGYDQLQFLSECKCQVPVRVLAECEAKRRIVEMHYDGAGNLYGPDTHFCAVCSDGVDYLKWPCPTLHVLALPYADHPDYDESWRP